MLLKSLSQLPRKHELFCSVILSASFCQLQNILSPLQPTGSNTGKNELPEVPKESLLYLAAHHSTFLWGGCEEGRQVLHPHWVLTAVQHSCLCLPWLPPQVLHPTAFLEAWSVDWGFCVCASNNTNRERGVSLWAGSCAWSVDREWNHCLFSQGKNKERWCGINDSIW